MARPSTKKAAGTVSAAGTIVIGTRGSALARWQADHIAAELRRLHPGLVVEQQIIVTEGDRTQTGPVIELGGKGVWVKEIEEKLLARRDRSRGAQPEGRARRTWRRGWRWWRSRRAPIRATRWSAASGATLRELPPGSRVGTSSLRRVCQLRAARADLTVELLRGNVDTRLRKVAEGVVDAAMLACAGLDRLGFAARITERLVDRRDAAGHRAGRAGAGGARRATSGVLRAGAGALSDPAAETTVAAERALLAAPGRRLPHAGRRPRHAASADA